MSISNGLLHEHPDLVSDLEEADVRITPPILHATHHGLIHIAILSADPDVIVIAMHYMHLLFQKDLLNSG